MGRHLGFQPCFWQVFILGPLSLVGFLQAVLPWHHQLHQDDVSGLLGMFVFPLSLSPRVCRLGGAGRRGDTTVVADDTHLFSILRSLVSLYILSSPALSASVDSCS